MACEQSAQGHAPAGWSRQLVEVITPSVDLAQSLRAWTCPHCDVGLPELPRYQLDESRNAQVTSVHPERKRDGSHAAKGLTKKWKKNPDSVPRFPAQCKKQSAT